MSEQSQEALLPLRRVCDRIGLHRATVYRMMATGEFPTPVKIGTRSLWVESEVQAWISARIADRSMGQSMGQKSAA